MFECSNLEKIVSFRYFQTILSIQYQKKGFNQFWVPKLYKIFENFLSKDQY